MTRLIHAVAMTAAALVFVFCVQCGLVKAEENWSRFRGPNGSGKPALDRPLPTIWSNDQGIRWKVDVPRGSSSPIVHRNRIFLTGYSGYAQQLDEPGNRDDLQLHVLAYDLKNGELLWDYQFAASENEQEATKRIADHGYASPTPCTDGSLVFASFGPSGIIALDIDGELQWRRDVGDGTAGFGAAASPIVVGDLVIINASIESKRLVAMDKATGEIRWEVEGIERAWTTPATVTLPDGSIELVIHYKNQVRGFDPQTGDELWHCEGIPDYVVPVAVVDGQRIYFSGGRQNRTLALTAGGRGDVSESHKLWEINKGANVTSPLVDSGTLYWAHDKGFAQAIDAETGELLYQERFRNRDRVYASVVLGDGKLFMTMRDGTTLVLAAKPEYEELAENRLGQSDEQFNATPAIVDGTLLFRSTSTLYRVGEPSRDR